MISKRIVAFLIDVLICVLLAQLPRFGTIIAAVVFILRDTKIFNYRSFGKKLCHIAIKDSGNKNGTNASSSKMIIRNMFFFIPILDIIDIYNLFRNGERLADKWMGLRIVLDK